FISKHLQAAGARLVWAVHPRMIRIVEGFLSGTGPDDVASRQLPNGQGSLKVEKVLPCDVGYDTMADVEESVRTDRRYVRIKEQYVAFSIEGLMKVIGESFGQIAFLIPSVAFSPEITKIAVETSRKAYLTAVSISAYSLTGLCRAATPLMADRPGGASVVS